MEFLPTFLKICEKWSHYSRPQSLMSDKFLYIERKKKKNKELTINSNNNARLLIRLIEVLWSITLRHCLLHFIPFTLDNVIPHFSSFNLKGGGYRISNERFIAKWLPNSVTRWEICCKNSFHSHCILYLYLHLSNLQHLPLAHRPRCST